jgi:hypothetical protein
LSLFCNQKKLLSFNVIYIKILFIVKYQHLPWSHRNVQASRQLQQLTLESTCLLENTR